MKEDKETINLFTERMRQLRLEKGAKEGKELTQVAVSKDLGVHVSTIRNYESPSLDVMPKIERLKKIKNYYNVSYDYLLGETNVRNSDTEPKGNIDETGLSAKAINYLKSLENDDELIFIINTIIEKTIEHRK